ncbi:MAG: DUF3280 domain-containing protein [Geminicoccaceae bacterium]|nr:DUF3280 domain-containing protein [Geminicoccaceae bacterium]
MRRFFSFLCLTFLACLSNHRPAAAEGKVALFPFELVSTSLEPVHDEELARLRLLDGLLKERLAERGYVPVATDPVKDAIGRYASLTNCGGCEVAMARTLGADLAAVGWVQKVSNLILNINLKITDVATGKTVKAGSVDIRSNTDDSWRRGLRYLLKNRLFKEERAARP